jgi:hypothetical protein
MVDPALFLVGLAALLLAASYLMERRGRPLRYRVVPSFARLNRAISILVENNQSAQIALGQGSILAPQAGSSLAALETLAGLSRLCLAGDSPPLASSGDGPLHLLITDAWRMTHNLRGSASRTNQQVLFTGASPFSYLAGAMLAQQGENIAMALITGSQGPEVGLLVEAAERTGAFTTGSSENLLAQAVLVGTTRLTFTGEEYFALNAGWKKDKWQAASLCAQDALRLLIIAAVLLGAVFKMAGK